MGLSQRVDGLSDTGEESSKVEAGRLPGDSDERLEGTLQKMRPLSYIDDLQHYSSPSGPSLEI